MTYLSPLPVPPVVGAPRITVLRCRDQFDLDPDPVLTFAQSHSPDEVEEMIYRALEDVAVRLDRLQAARATGAFEHMCAPARRIAVIAGGLGMTDVAQAARHVGCAAEGGSAVAVAATLARLERSFDAGISAVWAVSQPLA